MNPAAVETIDLDKRYAHTHALQGVTLRVEQGEIFALLGPNGAGKTTWISVVCGLVRPTGGTASVMGYDIATRSLEARRQLGLVPQEVNFDPFFTPREVLRFQLGYYGLPPNEMRIATVLEALDLTAKADAGTRELSGGMKRRLLIAKALVHRPKVAFLDEPTAGVDVALRRELWAYVQALRAEGTTIVLTTHYLEEAQALADRVAVIDHGRLVCVAPTAELLARYGRKAIHFTFDRPLEDPGALERLGVAHVLDESRTLLRCAVPEEGMRTLLGKVLALGPLRDLRTEQPSLEQVFLTLTGERPTQEPT